MSDTNNIFLDADLFPRFNDIKPSEIALMLDQILEQNNNMVNKVVNNDQIPDWNNLVVPLEDADDRLSKMWSPISHINSVKDSDSLRQAYDTCLPRLTEYEAELGQNKQLFLKLQRLRDSEKFSTFSQAQKKSIENRLLEFTLSGVSLDQESKEEYKKLTTRLSEISNCFARNLLDATAAWSLHVQCEEDLSGLPETVIIAAKAKAEAENKVGWVFTLQAPCFIPFLTYCNNADLRKQMYFAYVTRASEIGPNAGDFDNSEIIVEILKLRKQLANILGFDDYANYSLETKMAKGPQQVDDFLIDLADRVRKYADQENAVLKQFAYKHYAMEKINAWDRAWVSEKLCFYKYNISQETLRPYFPLEKVMRGMFTVVNRLFGITICADEVEQKWHGDVMFFRITDSYGVIRGYLYVDLFSREHKRGGAWMGECVVRRKLDGKIQLPVAFLTCNFPPPVGDKPSLLSHDDVMTLFHEFGHTLHHLLTKVDVADVSGINGVAWDAVELPSQFLENWCWESESLAFISGHYETGESIPDGLLKKMIEARNFQSAMQMQRQLVFSLFDMLIHQKSANIRDIEDVRLILNQVRKMVGAVDEPDFNRFESSFGHIFAGGYAAGYYSYKWAEVLSADAYSLFEETGLFNEKTGQSFLQNILEKGGEQEPADLFEAFRGREPSIDALLRHRGLQ